LTFRIKALDDSPDNPIRIRLPRGNGADIEPAWKCIPGLKAEMTITDKAAEADKLMALVEEQGAEVLMKNSKKKLKSNNNIY